RSARLFPGRCGGQPRGCPRVGAGVAGRLRPTPEGLVAGLQGFRPPPVQCISSRCGCNGLHCNDETMQRAGTAAARWCCRGLPGSPQLALTPNRLDQETALTVQTGESGRNSVANEERAGYQVYTN